MNDLATTVVPMPAVQTREQLETVLENIVHMRREREALWQDQERELNAVREKFRLQFTELDHCLELETNWAETWARANPDQLGEGRSLTARHATVEFRADPPHIERASRRWNWTRIALTLADLDWGKRYLRTPPAEVDKDAIVHDLPTLSPELLRTAGLKVFQGERFQITPHAETDCALSEAA
jgi:phage host-nuclease inhibitor protein Gam